MLFKISLGEAFRKIKKPELILEDVIIPKDCPFVSNSPYRQGYDWLFKYERRLARFLEAWLKKHRHELIGEKGILCEALSNAYYHGHKKNPLLPIEVKVYSGELGLIVQIKDKGTGFVVENIRKNYKKSKNYFHLAGNGLRLSICSKRFGVFYNTRGNVFHLVYLFDGNIAVLAKTELRSEAHEKINHGASCKSSKPALKSEITCKEPRG